MTLDSILDELKDVYNNCGSLLKSANNLALSSEASVRALAYEISISVSSIICEQQKILIQIQEIESESGAMAD